MLAVGTTYRCQNCHTEIEVINSQSSQSGPLVCCEVEMEPIGDEFEKLYEREAYDAMDFEWN